MSLWHFSFLLQVAAMISYIFISEGHLFHSVKIFAFFILQGLVFMSNSIFVLFIFIGLMASSLKKKTVQLKFVSVVLLPNYFSLAEQFFMG